MSRKKKMEDRDFLSDLLVLTDKYDLEMTIYPDEVIISLEQREEEDDS
jgi:hypothetical protein